MPSNPFILTATLDEISSQFFNEKRKEYFPARLNFLEAHLTLFHHLPATEKQIITDINDMVFKVEPIEIWVESVECIGNGVAYKIKNTELQQIHATFQKAWMPWLIPQDKQKLWPHITIQNKVAPDVAKALHAKLSIGFVPFAVKGTGFDLWEYLGGPWKFIKAFPFKR